MEDKNPLDGLFLKPDTKEEKSEFEDIKKIIEEWLNKKHIYAKTRLEKNQVIPVTTLKSVADQYNIKILKKWLMNFQTYKLSEGGESSKELIDILRERVQEEDGNDALKNISKFLES